MQDTIAPPLRQPKVSRLVVLASQPLPFTAVTVIFLVYHVVSHVLVSPSTAARERTPRPAHSFSLDVRNRLLVFVSSLRRV